MLLLWVVLLVLFLWMYFPVAGPGERFRKYLKKVHVYSGLDPESWTRFLVNMKTFESLLQTSDLDGAANALYASLENIRDMSLGTRRSDDGHHQEELGAIANELGYEGEFTINQLATAKGLQFFPKYLNESLDDYIDDGPAFVPSRVRSHGQ
jgi:hypothetical protein